MLPEPSDRPASGWAWGELHSALIPDGDFEGADLRGAKLANHVLSGACLRGAQLTGADLAGAFLWRTDLSSSDLRGARLAGAVLAEANLENADLSGARLDGAILIGANLTGADLSGAHLEGAWLKESVGLTQAQIESAVTDRHTELPDRPARLTVWGLLLIGGPCLIAALGAVLSLVWLPRSGRMLFYAFVFLFGAALIVAGREWAQARRARIKGNARAALS